MLSVSPEGPGEGLRGAAVSKRQVRRPEQNGFTGRAEPLALVLLDLINWGRGRLLRVPSLGTLFLLKQPLWCKR